MTTFLGIDFDTRAVHCTMLQEDRQTNYRYFMLEGIDAFERTRAVRDSMPPRAFWTDEGVVAIGIEEPQGVAKSTVAKLKSIQGAILACLPREALINPMVPASWRAAVGLPGNASKDLVAAFVRDDALHSSRLPETHRSHYRMSVYNWPQDAYDAYCLALAVERLTVEDAV